MRFGLDEAGENHVLLFSNFLLAQQAEILKQETKMIKMLANFF